MLDHLQLAALDPIFKLLAEFQADPNPSKVNLGIGMYQNRQGDPFVFPSIQKAFSRVDQNNFNYQPIGGNREYLNAVAELIFDNFPLDQLASVATCGGTQACRIFGDLLQQDDHPHRLLIGIPTWSNHFSVFKGLEALPFEHLDTEGELNFKAYREAIAHSRAGDVLLLHGGLTHNPSGRNLGLAQLEQLIPAIRDKQLIVFVDFAYCGLGEGFEDDKKWVQLLFHKLDQVAMGFSFSKNASLYEHRAGVLVVKTDRKEVIESHLQQLLRESVSMAPGLGQELLLTVLRDYRDEWLAELSQMRGDVDARKEMLIAVLPETFQRVKSCRGMFGILPLSEEQVLRLKQEFSIYLAQGARVNFAGVRPDQLEYIADSIRKVTRQ